MSINENNSATETSNMMWLAIVVLAIATFTIVTTELATIRLIMLWGVSISGIFVGFQTWVLRTAQDNAFSASAVYVSIFNAAIGSGALFGAWVVANFNFSTLMTYSAIAIALSLLITGIVPGRVEPSSSSQLGESA
jgi:predicted MFS family arabinose efflux permease